MKCECGFTKLYQANSERESDIALRGSYFIQFTCYTMRTQKEGQARSLISWVLYPFVRKAKVSLSLGVATP